MYTLAPVHSEAKGQGHCRTHLTSFGDVVTIFEQSITHEVS